MIALTAKKAIQNSRKPDSNGYINFQPSWFDVNSDDVPEAENAEDVKKIIQNEKRNLGLA